MSPRRLSAMCLLAALMLFAAGPLAAQDGDLSYVAYQPTDEHFPNPERGFFDYVETFPNSPILSPARLRAMRDESQTLIWALYSIGDFRDQDLPDSFLERLDADFASMREAGIKCVLRFRYALNMDQPDAPLDVVLRHLDQLQPVLERNYDVIAVAQGGFIGAWGEWHASSNDLTDLENMRAILFKFMDVLPERAIQIRYPKVKMDIFETSTGLTPEEAFTGTHKARAGHHNDCFLASRDDVGTYRIAPTWEKNYLNLETRFVPMGGETCRVQEGTRYYCETALQELAQMHWSYLNSDYYRGILDHWVEEGCMPEVKRRLGYRFVMKEGQFTSNVAPGGTFRFELDLENEGFASPYNPRGLQAVLRSTADPDETYEVNLSDDPRFWMAGETQQLAFDLGIPEDIPTGPYSLHLFMPDPVDALRYRPEYAIRLANDEVWEEGTGLNSLQHVVNVQEGADGAPYAGSSWFVEEEESVVSNEQPTVTPDGAVLHPAMPNPSSQEATIRFELARSASVKLDVYDAMGRRLARLADGYRAPGVHDVRFGAGAFPSGTYFCQLSTSTGAVATQSLVIVR